MDSNPDTGLQRIDHAMLTSLVRQALRSDTVDIGDYDCEEIHARGGGAEGVYRLLA